MINIENSGTITFEELKEGMRRVGSELMESEIKDLMDASRFEGLDDSTVPEIKRYNLSNVILQLSAVGVDNIIRFDFMEKPDRWLPLSDTILSMVVKHIPDLVNAQSFRISRLLPKREILDSDVGKSDVIAKAELVRKSVEACDSRPKAPCVAFVSKMFTVPIKMLPQRDVNGDIVTNYHEESGSGDFDECFFRVFSGVLHAGQKVFVLSALYDPLKTGE
ncbi:elongation factor-like GTPase 1, partial [Tanacetum coccineum]